MAQAYPAPAVVLGLGRFGLAVVERLGRDWAGLRDAGADASLGNLSLISVRAENAGVEERCLESERGSAALAWWSGEGDLPSLALDFVILRTLGLIRYHERGYEVAVPRDYGVVEIEKGSAEWRALQQLDALIRNETSASPSEEGVITKPASDQTRLSGGGAAGSSEDGEFEGEDKQPLVYRRRLFEWVELRPDPITSAEALRNLRSRVRDLDRFATPLLNRIKQGHSPETLLACIARCRALLDGRDPVPWGWLAKTYNRQYGATEAGSSATGGAAPEVAEGAQLHLSAETLDLSADHAKVERLQPKRAGAPIDGWDELMASLEHDPRPPGQAAPEIELNLPAVSLPRKGDISCPVRPSDLLRRDWESTGWANDGSGRDSVSFRYLGTIPLRLGLFDHQPLAAGDTAGDGRGELRLRQEEQLRRLGRLSYKGLVRLWVDLQRERVMEEDLPVMVRVRQRDHLDSAMRMSLEILGELVVRPIAMSPPVTGSSAAELPAPRDSEVSAATSADTVPEGSTASRSVESSPARGSSEPSSASATSASRNSRRTTYVGLSERPSRRLGRLVLERGDGSLMDGESVLHRRLADLGLRSARDRELRSRSLFVDIPLSHCDEEGDDSSREGISRERVEFEREARRFGVLRQQLRQQVEEMLSFQHLSQSRDKPGRMPPRLTVFVVGDMGEVFTRTYAQQVLREVHRCLLRAFTPIFESYRSGFDRSLCVTPIFWTPHPADPFDGEMDPEESEPESSIWREEAAIIDAIHGVRRWAETIMPASRRCISQIFVNSRVTDNSVLRIDDALRQSRDFLNLQLRNDLSRSQWLRRLSVSGGGSDLFSSFACYEIDFPAERCREYLANRLSRDCLQLIKRGPRRGDEMFREVPELDLPVDLPPRLVQEAKASIAERTRRAAEQVIDRHLSSHRITDDTQRRQVLDWFGEDFEAALTKSILARWDSLVVERGGLMDDVVDRLRHATSERLTSGLEEIRKHGDFLIQEYSTQAGLDGAQEALNALRLKTQEQLRRWEQGRGHAVQACVKNQTPSLEGVRRAREEVLRNAEKMPDLQPQRGFLWLWGGMSLVLGEVFGQLLSYWVGLHLNPHWGEMLLADWGFLTVGSVILATSRMIFLAWVKRRRRKVQRAIEALQVTVEQLFVGSGSEGEVGGGSVSAPRLGWLRKVPGIDRWLGWRERRRSLAEAESDLDAGFVSGVPSGRSLEASSITESERYLQRLEQGTFAAANASPSARSLLESRLDLLWVLAGRSLAQHLHEGAAADARSGDRLLRSLLIQLDELRRLAEVLGVVISLDEGESHEDPSGLLSPREDSLLQSADRLVHHYQRDFSDDKDLQQQLQLIFDDLENFHRWRTTASFSETQALLELCRKPFHNLVHSPVTELHDFARDMGQPLCDFVSRCFPNLGFGAEFRGFEGLDPDGIQLVADATLVVEPTLAREFRRAQEQEREDRQRRRIPERAATTHTLAVEEQPLRPNAAYMLSLVQGVRPHSVRNLKRFESFYDRIRLPDDRTFPLSHEAQHPRLRESINHLTGHQQVGEELFRAVKEASQMGGREQSSQTVTLPEAVAVGGVPGEPTSEGPRLGKGDVG